MKNKWTWIFLLVVAIAAAAFYFRGSVLGVLAGDKSNDRARAAQEQGNETADKTTTTIRPATDSNQVSAAGNIEVADEVVAVLQSNGTITEILVEVGDIIVAGDLLVSLDPTDLRRAIQRIELEVETMQVQLDKLLEPTSEADIAAAKASLISAQENLVEVKTGPSTIELSAAEAAVTAAQESYQDVLAGQSEAELVQLAVELNKSLITLQQAQAAYDEIAYRGDIGGTSQAADLQEATIDYEAAKAAYEVATEPASQAEIQAALRSIAEERVALENLRNQPLAADVAEAEANVANAEASLASLLEGPSASDLKEAELALEQAQLDLEEAEANLALARLRAPIAGTVLTVDIALGQQSSVGLDAFSLADLTNLELTVNVAEVDISKVQTGQPSHIAIDALPDQLFSGIVSRIAPSSQSEGGVVNYPVTITLDEASLDNVKPGMTAVATIVDEIKEAEWLVPTDALQEFEGETTVMVVRDGRSTPVEVTPGASQGEWTVVQSTKLKKGDEVVGQVSSFLEEEGAGGGRRGPFGPPPPRN